MAKLNKHGCYSSALSAISLSLGEETGFFFGRRPASYDSMDYDESCRIGNRTLLLNLNDSAQSNGSLGTWSFCYFILNSEDAHDIYVGVWRLANNTYHLVKESLTLLPKSDSYLKFDFVCLRHSVSPVEVLVGDVVGAIVTAIPATFNVVGCNEENEGLWMSRLPNGHNETSDTNLEFFQSFTLYLAGLKGMYL